MKHTFALSILLCAFNHLSAQTWTAEQLAAANTTDSIVELSQEEKDVFLYMNLARMYPQDFLAYEVNDDSRADKYYITLRQTLKKLKAMPPLHWDSAMQELTKCFAEEQSFNGKTGHKRKNCPTGYWGECLAYGNPGGKNIVLQLLIDENNPDYCHRKMIFSREAKSAGVSTSTHPKYARVSVINFKN